MGSFKDITGQKFGRLTAVKYLGKSRWLCKCDCGNLTEVARGHLKTGHTKSCGCLQRDPTTKKHYVTHDKSNTRLYTTYQGMKARCYRKSHKHYKDYGGRGITICDAWLNDFMSFYNWAIDNGYREGLTIDRIDNNKGYSPDNCRFITHQEQQNNRRNNVYITYNSETKSINDWATELNVNVMTLYTRRFKNWSVHDILFGRKI